MTDLPPTAQIVKRFREAMLEDVEEVELPGLGTLLRTPESEYHRNTYLCLDDLPAEHSEAVAKAVESLRERRQLNPDRAVAIVADGDTRLLANARRAMAGVGVAVLPLGAFLDSHLRPKHVCRQLQTGKDARGNDVLAGAGSNDLLAEKVFIDPNAYSEYEQRDVQGVRKHLFNTWAKGVGPRLAVVIAPAGHGKSMLSHLLGKQLADAYEATESEQKPPLPFLISFGNFRRGSTSFTGLIMDRLQADGPPLVNADAFKELLSLGRINFILDGFDEMIESNAETARQNIREFIDNAGSESRILLTSRSTFFRTRADVEAEFQTLALTENDVEILELRPFTEPQVREYLNRRLPEGSSRVLSRALKLIEEEGVAGAIKNPMFLREVVDLLRSDSFSITETRKDGLLEYLVKAALTREQDRQAHHLPPDDQREFIEAAALELLERDLPVLDSEELELLAQMYIPDLESSATRETEISALLNHYYLSEAAGGNGFTMHQIWREFFQASSLASKLEDGATPRVFTSHELPEGVILQIADRLSPDVLLGVDVARPTTTLASNWIRLGLAASNNSETLAQVVSQVGGLSHKQLKYVTFRDLDLRSHSFASSQLDGVLFDGCDLRGTDFTDASMRSVVIRRSVLSGSLRRAHVQSVEVDGTSYLHSQQLAATFSESSEQIREPEAAQDELSLREILRSRLALFVNAMPGGGDTHLVKPSLKESALTRGIDPIHADLIRRGVFPALVSAGLLGTSRAGRQSVIVVQDGVGREVLDFVLSDKVGPRVQQALEQLERRS